MQAWHTTASGRRLKTRVKCSGNRWKKMLLSNHLHFEAGSSWHKEQCLRVFKRFGLLLFLSGMWLRITLLPLLTGDKSSPVEEQCWVGCFFFTQSEIKIPTENILLSAMVSSVFIARGHPGRCLQQAGVPPTTGRVPQKLVYGIYAPSWGLLDHVLEFSCVKSSQIALSGSHSKSFQSVKNLNLVWKSRG